MGGRAPSAGRGLARARRAIAAGLLLPLLGCSSVHAWQADRPFVPLGADRAHAASGRGTVRLLLPAPVCVVEGATGRAREEEAPCARELGERAFAVLRAGRGTEVLLPELLGSAGGPQAEAAAQLAGVLEDAWRFALAAPDGAPPPPALAARVRDACARWRAEGLVLLRLELQRPAAWNWALLAVTLLQSWPVLVLGQHVDVRVDVFEAASGGIVWRYSERIRPIPEALEAALAGAFGAIEAAAPREGGE